MMSEQPTPKYRPTRFAFFIAGNLALALFMLVALVFLQSGQKGFLPYTSIDKDYVNGVIASGEAATMHKALKITEIARAGAYEDYVSMMSLLQLAAIALAALFAMNTYFLIRLRTPLKAMQPVAGDSLPRA